MNASITRQHFNAIAQTIASTPGLTDDQRADLADRMVTALYKFNHNIDRARFVRVATDVPEWLRNIERRKDAEKDAYQADHQATIVNYGSM